MAVLGLVVFLLISLWLGRREASASENLDRLDSIEGIQAQLKILVRDCDG